MIEKLIENHYTRIGVQMDENNQKAFELYNCNHCKITISEKNLIAHYKDCGILYDKFKTDNKPTTKFMTKKYEV